MSALEQLKKIQQQIENLNLEIEIAEDELRSAQDEITDKKGQVQDLESKVSLVVACMNEEKKAEQEAFNTLLVKFKAGGVTDEDFKSYAAERGTSTQSVYPEPTPEEEAQSSAA